MKNEEQRQIVIHKVLNHNVVQGYDIAHKKEYLIYGKAVGFQKKVGDKIESDTILKSYEIKDQANLSAYESLLGSSDEETIHISEEIISKLTRRFGTNYNENLHISLLDHLNFSIYRYRNNINMQNIFLEEIGSMYPNEFQFAAEMVDFVNESLQIQLPDAEIGFICMHIHSAYHDNTASNTALIVTMIGQCISFIEQQSNLKLKQHSVERQRLVTHLKFAFKRAKDHISIKNPMNDSIKEKYPKSHSLAKSLAHMLENDFMILLQEGEIGYLAIHIQSILMTNEDQT